MSLIPRKVTFMAKYGNEADRAKVSDHVDSLLDKADKGTPALFGELARSSEIPLNSNQTHRIIESPRFDGMLHPMESLVRFHSGDLTDEHWNKIAKTMTGMGDAAILAHMPPQHLPTVFNNEKIDPFIRRLAKNRHTTFQSQDPDTILRKLQE
jgi:hypothetical protein